MELFTGIQEQTLVFICLCLAVFRLYLEVIGFDFSSLPISRSMGETNSTKVHKVGLYLSLGYIILFGPQYLLS